jgi:hypothetical protein
MSDGRQAAMHRYEVGRALRSAQHISVGEISDTNEAIRELARAVAALAQAVEDILESRDLEREHSSSV